VYYRDNHNVTNEVIILCIGLSLMKALSTFFLTILLSWYKSNADILVNPQKYVCLAKRNTPSQVRKKYSMFTTAIIYPAIWQTAIVRDSGWWKRDTAPDSKVKRNSAGHFTFYPVCLLHVRLAYFFPVYFQREREWDKEGQQ
jgi:hypothetical protein